MQPLSDLAQANGFKAIQVSKTEFVDGIGATIGLNFVKNQVFYTTSQMVKELGFEIKNTSGKIKARNRQDAEQQIVSQMAGSGVKAAQITGCNEYKAGEFFIKVQYIK